MTTGSNPVSGEGLAIAPVAGTPEYEAAMAELGSQVAQTSFDNNGHVNESNVPASPSADEQPPQPAEEQSERPEWLPEKFKSPEDLAKAYGELEKKLGKPAEPAEQAPPTEGEPQVPAGVDLPALEAEYATNGTLSEDSYNKLAQVGLTKEVVDLYIAGREALQEQVVNEGYSLVGGQDKYAAMTAWAQANLAPAEVQAFNSAVLSDNRDVAKLAIQGLNAKYVAANGSAPTGLLSGIANPVQPSGGFQSNVQMTDAINDPRYKNDPAYRAEVQRRIAASPDNLF